MNLGTGAAPAPFENSGGPSLWPWIALVIAAIGGAGFVAWRRSQRPLLADGPQFDLLAREAHSEEPASPPERVPTPTPEPAAAKPKPVVTITSKAPAAPKAPSGIVATGLRPALEIGFQPVRCDIDNDQVSIEFELELYNSGAAPARAVLAEASLLNAGATQESDLTSFFANPNGVGDRLEVIPPLQRVSFRSRVSAPRAAVQEYELAGRRAFVPVIAFNALYEWSGGKAQSSAAYLVGRDTQQDKLGPLRLDQGARQVHGLGARPLPSSVRT